MSSQRSSRAPLILPSPAPLVGRKAERDALRRAVLQAWPLIALTGPAGIGKSRLLADVRDDLIADRFVPGAAWMHTCAQDVGTFDELTAAIAQAARIATAVGASPDERLRAIAAALHGHPRAVLVVDHTDGCWDVALDVAARLRPHVPGLTVVLTSRRPRSPGDIQPIALGPLATSTAGDASPVRAPAVALMTGFLRENGAQTTDLDGTALGWLARRLAGHPWALTVTAGHLLRHSPGALLERLPDAAATAETLASHVWHMLEPWARDALTQLTTFADAFTAEQARLVIDLGPHPDAPRKDDAVHTLIACSLLTESTSTAGRDRVRFTLAPQLVGLAASAFEDEEDRQDAELRHARVVIRSALDLAERADRHDGATFRARLEHERSDVELALARLLNHASPDHRLRTLSHQAVWALDPLLSVQGPFDSHLPLLDAVLAMPSATEPDQAWLARAFEARGRARRARGMLDEAQTDFEAAACMAEEGGDAVMLGRALANIGTLHLDRGDITECRAFYDRAFPLLDQGRARGIEGRGHVYEAMVSMALGELQQATASLEAGLRDLTDIGDHRWQGICWSLLGDVAHEQGKSRDALSFYAKALALHREVRNLRHEGKTLVQMGRLQFEAGRIKEAEHLFEEALRLFEHTEDTRSEGHLLGLWGNLCLDRGNLDAALELYEDAQEIHHETQNRREEVSVLCRLGVIYAVRDELADAETAFLEAQSIAMVLTDPFLEAAMDVYQGLLDQARERRAHKAGDHDAASNHRERARERIAKATHKDGETPAVADRSAEVRDALRLLIASRIHAGLAG